MTWHILAIICVLTLSVATLLARVLMKHDKSDPIGYAIIFQFILAMITLTFAISFNKFTLPPISKLPLNFLASSLLWAGSTVFSLKAIRHLNAGESKILGSTGSLITIILGIFILQETFTIKLFLGTLLILLAIWIISANKISFKSRKGIIFALVAAACSGTAVVNDAFILKSYEAFSYTAVMSFLPGIVLLVLFFNKAIKLIRDINLKLIITMTVFCFFYAVQAITYYLALENSAPISQLSPIIQSSVIVTVILAAIFLKEHNQLLRKLAAAIAMTIGITLLG